MSSSSGSAEHLSSFELDDHDSPTSEFSSPSTAGVDLPPSSAGTEAIRDTQPQAGLTRSRRNKLRRTAKALHEFSKHHGDGAGAPLRPKRVWLRSPHWLASSYRSKQDEFHKLFKQLPADSFLIDDYSCAVQKDILIHGRMYVTQEHLCFYSSIFGFETSVVVNLSDVVSVSPEKTAHLIPNALRVTIKNDKNGGKEKSYWFTSFISRDTSFTVLMKVWQNRLMGFPMTPINLRHFACRCWGVKPDVELLEGKSRLSGDEQSVNSSENGDDYIVEERESEEEETDSEEEVNEVECGCENHSDTCFINTVYSISAEKMFEAFFADSSFMQRLSNSRKLTEIQDASWEAGGDEEVERRELVYTMPMKGGIGPKSSVTTEHQRLVEQDPGRLYRVRVEVTNAGVPYSESFYTYVEYCITYVSRKSCRLRISACIRYRKSVMGFIKSIIERQAAESMKEHYVLVEKVLAIETAPKKKRRGATHAPGEENAEEDVTELINDAGGAASPKPQKEQKSSFMEAFLRVLVAVFFLLLFVNAVLLGRLLLLPAQKQSLSPSTVSFPSTELPQSPDGWRQFLFDQRQLQHSEIKQVKSVLSASGRLLTDVVTSLEQYASIHAHITPDTHKSDENLSKAHAPVDSS